MIKRILAFSFLLIFLSHSISASYSWETLESWSREPEGTYFTSSFELEDGEVYRLYYEIDCDQGLVWDLTLIIYEGYYPNVNFEEESFSFGGEMEGGTLDDGYSSNFEGQGGYYWLYSEFEITGIIIGGAYFSTELQHRYEETTTPTIPTNDDNTDETNISSLIVFTIPLLLALVKRKKRKNQNL
jgi:hypothetical protein